MSSYAIGSRIPPAQYAERFPRAPAAIVRAINGAQRGAWLDACPHVAAGWPKAFLCVGHPAAGFLCEPCFSSHLERHVPLPLLCGECGDSYAPGTSTAIPLIFTTADAAVRDPQRRVASWTGTMAVVGTAVCPDCWGRAPA